MPYITVIVFLGCCDTHVAVELERTVSHVYEHGVMTRSVCVKRTRSLVSATGQFNRVSSVEISSLFFLSTIFEPSCSRFRISDDHLNRFLVCSEECPRPHRLYQPVSWRLMTAYAHLVNKRKKHTRWLFKLVFSVSLCVFSILEQSRNTKILYVHLIFSQNWIYHLRLKSKMNK